MSSGGIGGDLGEIREEQRRERERRIAAANASRALHSRPFLEYSMRGFDPLYYLGLYPDLKRAFGDDQVAACRHYLRHGVDELRCPNPFLDPYYYREIHPDLHGHNPRQLVEHWYLHGVEEGRRGSPAFWLNWYVGAHSDLDRIFGPDLVGGFDHWKRHGHEEQRRTAPDKTLQLYWADVPLDSGSFQMVDEQRECIPEAPIREEPSTGQILGLACKVLKMRGIEQACKKAIDRIVKYFEPDYVICTPGRTDGIRVREDPIFRGDIFVPDEISRTA